MSVYLLSILTSEAVFVASAAVAPFVSTAFVSFWEPNASSGRAGRASAAASAKAMLKLWKRVVMFFGHPLKSI
jgi:hypothetical protein